MTTKMPSLREIGLCPQCASPFVYVKNEYGERRAVFVTVSGDVVPKHEGDSLDGFDLTEVWCYGCSWHGSPERIRKRH